MKKEFITEVKWRWRTWKFWRNLKKITIRIGKARDDGTDYGTESVYWFFWVKRSEYDTRSSDSTKFPLAWTQLKPLEMRSFQR